MALGENGTLVAVPRVHYPDDRRTPDRVGGTVRASLLQIAVNDAELPQARRERVAALVRAQAGADLVVLPDEPYRFTADDGPEAFPLVRAALVDGRMLTWYGPSLAAAPAVLSGALRAACR